MPALARRVRTIQVGSVAACLGLLAACSSTTSGSGQSAPVTTMSMPMTSPTTSGVVTTSSGGPTPVAPSGAPATTTDIASFLGSSFDAGSPSCTFHHQVATIAGDVLSVEYPAGSSAPSAGAPYGGAQVCVPFAAGVSRKATLSYQVRFPVGFQFIKGGKLPGLYGGHEPFSGGKHSSGGWSLRLMWRTNGQAEVYAYVAATNGYGDEYGKGKFSWKADGQWHTVTETMQLNDPGSSNGSVRLAYDGVTYIDQTGLDISDTSTLATGVFFSTFYGGHDRSWAPTALMHVDFRNFQATLG